VAYGPDAPIIELEMAYLVFNTLYAAIGRDLRLSSTDDIPDDLLNEGHLILVGTAEHNPLISAAAPKHAPGKGTILLHDAGQGRQWLLLTGDGPDAVKAAACDYVLRFWMNAKDSCIRITGTEKGAALGNPTAVYDRYLP
jgi:hypothetical protein